MKSQIIAAKHIYGIEASVATIIALFPFTIVFFLGLLLLMPLTRPMTLLVLTENQSIGLVTFMFLIAGGLLGLRLVLQIKKYKSGLLAFWFYLLFSIGLLFMGMEEVSWGQRFFRSETPSSLNNVHQQTETPVKNIPILRYRLEVFPLTFGLAGFLGIWLSTRPCLRKIAPPYILLSWFIVIALISAIDLSHDFYIFLPILDDVINPLEEVIEMLVGISGFLFIWLNRHKFSFCNARQQHS